MNAKKPAAGQAAQVEAAVAACQETVETAIQAGRAAIGMVDIDKAAETAREQADKAQQAVFDGYERMAALAQANLEACAESVAAATRGAEVIGKEVAGRARTSLKTGVSHGKAMMACKTVDEAVERQGEILCAGLDSMVAGTVALTEMSVSAASDAFAPVRKQASRTLQDLFGPTAS